MARTKVRVRVVNVSCRTLIPLNAYKAESSSVGANILWNISPRTGQERTDTGQQTSMNTDAVK